VRKEGNDVLCGRSTYLDLPKVWYCMIGPSVYVLDDD
jgi:hypothetical protein